MEGEGPALGARGCAPPSPLRAVGSQGAGGLLQWVRDGQGISMRKDGNVLLAGVEELTCYRDGVESTGFSHLS